MLLKDKQKPKTLQFTVKIDDDAYKFSCYSADFVIGYYTAFWELRKKDVKIEIFVNDIKDALIVFDKNEKKE